MVIGDVEYGTIVNLLYEAQKTLHREITPKVYSTDEWRSKRAAKSFFVQDVASKPKIFLIGTQHDLDELA